MVVVLPNLGLPTSGAIALRHLLVELVENESKMKMRAG